MSEQTRYLLNESDLPKQWYNVLADSPVPPAAGVESANAGRDHPG